MRDIVVHDCYGIKHQCAIYNCKDLPINDILKKSIFVKSKVDEYVNIPCAFDIETTSINADKPYGFMYHWQFCIDECVCFGRTWEEFTILINRLDKSLENNAFAKYVVYVHNLAYEFQFINQFIKITSIFAREKKKPLVVRTANHIEFRCSYILSNMSLSSFCKNTKGCKFWKKDGDNYDYLKVRLPSTPLNAYEEEYCYCDVRGLCECIKTLLEEDTLASIPMTSTGYVRREFKDAMLKNTDNRKLFEKLRLSAEQYDLCKKAFRGGNTSSNSVYVGEIINNVESDDLQSSYPAAMVMDKYPMTKFIKVTINSREKFDRYINRKACLFRIIIDDLHIKDLYTIPYIARGKVLSITDARCGNGRVISAKRIELAVTDIDWKIIESHYTMGKKVVPEMYIAEYGYLPTDFRNMVIYYFRQKCELKSKLKEMIENGISSESEEYKNLEYLYAKFKNRINAAYGMLVTDIASPDISFEDGEWQEFEGDIKSRIDAYYKSKKSFLSYQHGVWVTANARKRLQDMLDIIGSDCIYIDTDSIKYIGNHIADFEKVNVLHRRKLAELDIDAIVTIGDVKYYIGEWEYEGKYRRFKTLGSKKYIYEDTDGVSHLTLAGVNKQKGSEWFSAHGGCDAFNIGLILKSDVCGRNTAYYNTEKIHKFTIKGETFTTASNIAIIPTTYQLGITDEYLELIKDIREIE